MCVCVLWCWALDTADMFSNAFTLVVKVVGVDRVSYRRILAFLMPPIVASFLGLFTFSAWTWTNIVEWRILSPNDDFRLTLRSSEKNFLRFYTNYLDWTSDGPKILEWEEHFLLYICSTKKKASPVSFYSVYTLITHWIFNSSCQIWCYMKVQDKI